MKCEACDHENMDGARFCAGCGALLPTDHKGEDPMVGQLVGGRYRVTGVLGEGGMGIVYIGEQQMGSTVRKVAIKTLHQHLQTALADRRGRDQSPPQSFTVSVNPAWLIWRAWASGAS